MNLTQYITGGVVGTIFGYGIGHAVQGRYTEIGWLFTATEVAFTAAIIASPLIAGAPLFTRAPATNMNWPVGASVLSGIGSLGLLGFRIWEIVDLWATPQQQSRVATEQEMQKPENHLAFAPVLLPNYAGLSVQF